MPRSLNFWNKAGDISRSPSPQLGHLSRTVAVTEWPLALTLIFWPQWMPELNAPGDTATSMSESELYCPQLPRPTLNHEALPLLPQRVSKEVDAGAAAEGTIRPMRARTDTIENEKRAVKFIVE